MKEKLTVLKEKLLKQAEQCRLRILACDDEKSWGDGYNHGARNAFLMLINDINEIIKE